MTYKIMLLCCSVCLLRAAVNPHVLQGQKKTSDSSNMRHEQESSKKKKPSDDVSAVLAAHLVQQQQETKKRRIAIDEQEDDDNEQMCQVLRMIKERLFFPIDRLQEQQYALALCLIARAYLFAMQDDPLGVSHERLLHVVHIAGLLKLNQDVAWRELFALGHGHVQKNDEHISPFVSQLTESADEQLEQAHNAYMRWIAMQAQEQSATKRVIHKDPERAKECFNKAVMAEINTDIAFGKIKKVNADALHLEQAYYVAARLYFMAHEHGHPSALQKAKGLLSSEPLERLVGWKQQKEMPQATKDFSEHWQLYNRYMRGDL